MLTKLRLIAALVLWASFACVCAEERKPEAKQLDPKDPLSKFTEEDLADPGVAAQKFFEAIDGGDAEVIQAFLAEVPKHLDKLDLKKKEERAHFLKSYANYKGATVQRAQRIAAAGVAQITYDLNGVEKTMRMQNVGGRWKYVGD